MVKARATSAKETPIPGARILVVEARFYEDISDHLLAGAMARLQQAGVGIEHIRVPGSLEIPVAAAIELDIAAKAGIPFDGVVALGCVIRGETLHFEIVAHESARALIDLAVARKLPLGNGILTVENRKQALVRARADRENKGGAAASAALALVRIARARAPVADVARPRPQERSVARLAAVQALYQMDLAGTELPEILADFQSHWIGREIEGETYAKAEAEHFRDIAEGVVREQRSLDPMVDAALLNGWPLKRIETVLRAILRAGAYELVYRKDVPARVVISEYVDVAAAFLDEEETGMVNAVLDTLARSARGKEFEAPAAG